MIPERRALISSPGSGIRAGRRKGVGMEDASFGGRAVLVFGAAGALGAGVAEAFAAAGASVTGVDRTEPGGDRRLAGVRYQAANVLDDGALGRLFDSAPAPWAVLNTLAELAGQLELNLVTAALITKHALRVMKPAGEGRIVHTASRAGVVSRGSGF